MHSMNLSDQKRWSQDPSLPWPHLRVGSGGKGISLVIPRDREWYSKGEQLVFFISVPMVVVYEQIFSCCS